MRGRGGRIDERVLEGWGVRSFSCNFYHFLLLFLFELLLLLSLFEITFGQKLNDYTKDRQGKEGNPYEDAKKKSQ